MNDQKKISQTPVGAPSQEDKLPDITIQTACENTETKLGLTPYRRGMHPNSQKNRMLARRPKKGQTFRTIARTLGSKSVTALQRYFQSPKRTGKERIVGKILNQAINGQVSSALLFERWTCDEDENPNPMAVTAGGMAILIADEIRRGMTVAGNDEEKLKRFLDLQARQVEIERELAELGSDAKDVTPHATQ